VGVVAAIRRDGKTATISPQVYLPAAQTEIYPVRLADFAVRTQTDPRQLVTALQREVWAIDKDQPLTNIKTLDEVIADSVAQRRFPALLLLLFAFVALVLTMIGIYGVISYSVSQRTAEIGIRVALGARPGDVLRLVLRQALWLIGVGITGGLLGAYALSRYLSSLLFAITAADPPTYGVVAVMLAVVALFACYAPARRAARVDPVVALRCD